MTYQNNITNEDIEKLKTTCFNGTIHVISKAENIPAAVKELRMHSVIGFDTETKPSFKKGQVHKVAMIQLAVPGEVYLIRINKTGLTKDLTDLLEDPKILKAGVSVRDDLKKLRQMKNVHPEGFIELQDYSDSFNIESNSLKKLAAIVLGIKISKSQRLTNWEAGELTEEQLIYAATDAWVCLEVYLKLSNSGIHS